MGLATEETRKLAAIMFTDMVGCSALAQRNVFVGQSPEGGLCLWSHRASLFRQWSVVRLLSAVTWAAPSAVDRPPAGDDKL